MKTYNEISESHKERQRRLLGESESEEQNRWILEDLWQSIEQPNCLYSCMIEFVKRYGKSPGQDIILLKHLNKLYENNTH